VAHSLIRGTPGHSPCSTESSLACENWELYLFCLLLQDTYHEHLNGSIESYIGFELVAWLRFEVLMTASIKFTVSWHVTPYTVYSRI
jgi:hypothetical protein